MLSNKSLLIGLIVYLLVACAPTKPLPRCNDAFQPINPDTVSQP